MLIYKMLTMTMMMMMILIIMRALIMKVTIIMTMTLMNMVMTIKKILRCCWPVGQIFYIFVIKNFGS